MSSTRKPARSPAALLAPLLLLAPALTGTGCAPQQPAGTPPEKPMVVDAAM